MRGLVVLFAFLVTINFVLAHNRGCRYIMGRCVEDCPEGTHSYNSNCRSPTWTERTCDEPEKRNMGTVCDLSRCDCDEPTVKDRTTGKCVKLEDCPKKKVPSKL